MLLLHYSISSFIQMHAVTCILIICLQLDSRCMRVCARERSARIHYYVCLCLYILCAACMRMHIKKVQHARALIISRLYHNSQIHRLLIVDRCHWNQFHFKCLCEPNDVYLWRRGYSGKEYKCISIFCRCGWSFGWFIG